MVIFKRVCLLKHCKLSKIIHFLIGNKKVYYNFYKKNGIKGIFYRYLKKIMNLNPISYVGLNKYFIFALTKIN